HRPRPRPHAGRAEHPAWWCPGTPRGARDDRPGSGPGERSPRAGGRSGTGRPATGGARPPRTGEPRSGGPGARTTRDPRDARDVRSARDDRPERPARPVGPALPPDADPELLPREVRRELRGIPDPAVEKIAAHLVAAGRLVDDDPAAAYEHAKYAKTLATRVGAVREAVGVTAYRAGDYGAALTELKAARRITGIADHLPLLADCERALGHPDKALAYASDPGRETLDRPSQVELTIVLAGARRDLGQPEAAVLALQGPELDSDVVEPWTVRLWYAYADALLAAGRREEAGTWFTAVAAIDEDEETDAEERLAGL
ncbi:MAG TPA: hypothetical protein VNA20_13455, partial [Frankiaceae bacterium]|nr:hypothetical protein [Frankiaceae bacterium]